MAKSRSFSIYLLKAGFDATNSLREDHALESDFEAADLPANAVLYVLDSEPYPPWWKAYFNISEDLTQVGKGALVFLPVNDRCFALSFGHVAHNLRETSYEYDFGLRVTLNSLDSKRLKSTDTLDPGAAKRRRTQLPIESDLTFFDFDRDSTILKSLTGKVRDDYKDLFKHATGGSNLRISSDVVSAGLVGLATQLLQLYESEQYKEAFPDIQNISPIRDPDQVDVLNDRLIQALREGDEDLNLTVPEIINYHDNVYVMFAGAGTSLIYDDVYIGRYREYLNLKEVDLDTINVAALRQHSLMLTDEEGSPRDRFSIFKSLVFETTIHGAADETFHLSEGNWYKVEKDYIARLGNYLDPLHADSDLPPYNHATEGEYNVATAAADPSIVCLDKTSVGPNGQTAVEPCDLLAVRNDLATFYHIKVSTLSAQLSHLFSQGVNAIELLRLEVEAGQKLKALINEKPPEGGPEQLLELLDAEKSQIIFGIVTRKEPGHKSLNLPLFSRISLKRAMRDMQLMNIPAKFAFIKDESVPALGRKKKRKKKAAAA